MPGLGWKDGWEQAPFHVAWRLAPLGSMAPEPSHNLSGSPPAGHLPPLE